MQVQIRCQGADTRDIDELVEFQGELKTLTKPQYEQLRGEILHTGFAFPIHAWHSDGKDYIIGGHQRKRVLTQLRAEGYDVPPVPVVWIEANSYEEAKRRVLQDVAQYGQIERQGLYEFMHDAHIEIGELKQDFKLPDLNLADFEDEFFKGGESGGGSGEGGAGSLADRFLVPPFSVLDARQGYWQSRKREWLGLGIQSEIGRSDELLGNKSREGFGGDYDLSKGESAWGGAGTSIFDPVLCELAYRWFSPKGGTVLDPFAGGSVRGIVASKLGRQYVGLDLREEQVVANRDQARVICQEPHPVWEAGDSRGIQSQCEGVQADLVFSCPPYADLEVYSEDPRDLSTLEYPEFRDAYFEIIQRTCAMLKEDRFAVFVVGEVRQKGGGGPYYGFVNDTIEAFKKAGLQYYNELVLVTAVGSLPLRSGRIFSSTRKVGKTHQNLLVFCKGDPKAATEACGEVQMDEELFKKYEEELSSAGAGE